MSKSQKIRKLLEDNREVLLNGEENNGICFDGIVDEENYKNVVVLLKETNGCDTNGNLPEKFDDWDYCKWLKEQQAENKPEERINKKGEKYIEENVFYHSTFRKLCYWLCLLFDTLENEKANPEKFMKNGQVNIEEVRKILKSVAVVNLKKSWGNKQTNSADLSKYVLQDEVCEVLNKQLDILEPKIVLCCSPDVFGLASLVLSDLDYYVTSQTIPGKDIQFATNNKNEIYVDFYHPQYYGKTDEQFSNYAIEVFKHLKNYMHENNMQ